MKIFSCDTFTLPLPPNHRFPMQKYTRLQERILAEGVVGPTDIHIPDAATDAQIARCHDADYINKVKHGLLTQREIRRIGFPWSPELVERSRRSSGATTAACRAALTDGVALNLAGGTHHACRDHGEGFCVFNDAAIAARTLQAEQAAARVLIVDLDVHQGNGTAQITHTDPTIFTLSIHGEKNFPFRKFPSNIDIGLPNNTADDAYLATLYTALPLALSRARPDLAVYIAGADPFIGDRLGKLSLSKAGLAERDRYVFQTLGDAGVPVGVAMGGGYAPNVEDIVDVHLNTTREAAAAADRWRVRPHTY